MHLDFQGDTADTLIVVQGNTPGAGKRAVMIGLNGWANVGSVIAGQIFKAKYKPACT